jgi:hypothetical protein
MPKTAPAGEIEISSGERFATNAMPDPFDQRDFDYRPRLQPLPAVLDQRVGPAERHVMRQDGNSCTGHALASVINAVLARTALDASERPQPDPPWPHVSPYMLYRLARRYDEFPGETDAGSSLRGALKGWYNHGVLLDEDWPALEMDDEPDLDTDAFAAKARERPLGAFYRVNPFRLDDMQSAITELNAVCASAVVHSGWEDPRVVERDGEKMHVIARTVDARSLGGHAFAIVGYNRVGFLVQNSWGPAWGRNGFATLPYEDWLQSAYDAWVVRPGVPHTPLAGGWSMTTEGTGGRAVTGAGPDLRRLASHVVNLGNDGRLSGDGRFTSTPAQVGRIFAHMGRWHDHWRDRAGATTRHVLLYAHGGLNKEATGLRNAQENLNWWLNNQIYPIFFAWESGVAETLLSQLADTVRGRLPAGIGFDVMEHVDRLIEGVARRSVRWMWDEMKENARKASEPIADRADGEAPGASLTVRHLGAYIDAHGADTVRVHLVGHSAGAIFHAALLAQLAQANVAVDTLTMLAPALRVDDFARQVLPRLGNGVGRFAVFNLSDQRELDDACGPPGFALYHKSLLYLVSRALEQSGSEREVPLLGMQRFFGRRITGGQRTLQQAIEREGGACVFSRSTAPADSCSDAEAHGGFAADAPTMTSVVMRILGNDEPTPANQYRPNAALRAPGAPPSGDGPAAGADGHATSPRPVATAQPTVVAEAHPPGDQPLAETAEPQTTQPQPPGQPATSEAPIEVADAPRSGSPIIDLIAAEGWETDDESGEPPATHR